MLLPDYDELVSLKKQTLPVELTTKTKVASSTLGGHRSLFKGRGLDFSEFREYAFGDDVRAIDWRVTARTGRAHTKIFTEERERSVYILVDINQYMAFGTRHTFKSIQAARVASLLAWKANSLQDKTGAILFGHISERIRVLPAKRSRRSIWEMLKLLSTPGNGVDEVKIEEALETANRYIPIGSSVFIISDFFDVTDAFEKQFALLSKKRDITLVKVSDPADKTIPAVDALRFSDEKGNEALVNTNDSRSGNRYSKLWHESDSKLTQLARKFRSKVVRVATDSEVTGDLFCGGHK